MTKETIRTKDELESENKILRSASSCWDNLRKTSEEAIINLDTLNHELHDRLQRLEFVVKAADIGWWDWDVPTGKLSVNPTRAALSGMSPESFPDNFGEVVKSIHPDDHDMVMQKIQQHLQGEIPVFEAEYRISNPGGNYILVYDRGQVVEKDILGKPIRMTGIMINVQSTRSREIEMKEALEKAEAANRDKSIFLSEMAHEIYTPLAGVIGMADILRQSELTPEQEEYLEAIVNSSANLISVFNDIIDFLKIESHKIELSSVPFSLRHIMEDVLNAAMENRQEKEIEVLSFIDPNIPDTMKGDPARIRQLLNVFMDNAIKFTEKGYVALQAWFKEWNDDFVTLQFCVTDTGIGISPEGISKLFRSFSKVSTSATTKYGGSGLGLAIARYLIQKMGGDVQVESTEGSGTSFIFTVQVERNNGAGVQTDFSQCRNWKVMLVDEHAFRRGILSDYLIRMECDVDETRSIQEAIAHAGSGTAARKYDLIIADEKTMGGENFQFKAPVLLVADQMIPRNSRKVSADLLFVHWPLFPESLLDAMVRAHTRKKKEAALPEPESEITSPALQKRVLNVLLAEDNLINQKVAMVTLKKLGHSTDLAENGVIALECFRKKDYDLILMDIHMPEMDGIECTRKIREIESNNPDRKPVHICAITANPLKDDEEACLNAGMNSYISKPFHLEELTAVTEKL